MGRFVISSDSVETSGVYGREAELENLRSFLAMRSPGAFLLRGEAGIGKTTLWEAGVAVARRAGGGDVRIRSTHSSGSLRNNSTASPSNSETAP